MVGCGCLIPGFIVIVAVALFAMSLSEHVNESEAWKSLAGVIRYDDSARGPETGVEDDPSTNEDESRGPTEFQLLMGGEMPLDRSVEVYWFGRDMPSPRTQGQVMGNDPLSVTLIKEEQSLAEMAARSRPGTPLHEDRTYEVKGRVLRGRVLQQMVSDSLHIKLSGLDKVSGAGAVVWLREGFTDPEEEGKLFDLLAFFQRPGSVEPIKDEEIERFLAPFDLESFPGSLDAEDDSKK
ncbi:hypothetical protein Poly30_43970 [Planctomycetes bacterium Poly30]|uniref:Uncharacterized protein n=2 Tax=Saltatorellus ferox TaxID=2528018 RepID=A0A518EXN0_9BACT|nr:hypothetical protein Poly30_43970 [Planctomycetes bacterium Poly30]